MKPSAKEMAIAKDRGASCRRNGGKPADNPWKSANTEHGRMLRDEWDDAYHQERKR